MLFNLIRSHYRRLGPRAWLLHAQRQYHGSSSSRSGIPAGQLCVSRRHLAEGHLNSAIEERIQDLELHIGLRIKELGRPVGESQVNPKVACRTL